jgi:uncharacterized protein involved in outer membrane biogenesis
LVVVALFAALIVPWFVNWNDYRTAFETEAEKILGHPVRVNGTATASILPSPSLTFTDVEVGDPAGVPLMTVKQFSATIELIPLLQGEIRVVAMKLEQPDIRVGLDGNGTAEWLMRSEASRGLSPGKVVLEDVEVVGGRLTYTDVRSGIVLAFNGIQAAIDARSLLGPWHVDGSYLQNGQRVPFHATTGIRQDDGSFRVKGDWTPPGFPFSIAADGVLSLAPTGLTYRGNYNVVEVTPVERGADAASGTGWRSDGMFSVNQTGLTIESGTVAVGPVERPTAVTGSGVWPFAKGARFSATLQARQLDLDRALGGGPNEPVEVARVQAQLAAAIKQLPPSPVPGSLTFAVPAIVVGGSLVQEVTLAASITTEGWTVDAFHARLPGQTTIDASGKLANGAFSFKGNGRLAVAQPVAFATWLRGRSQEAGRLLPAFDLSGDIDVGEIRVAVDKAVAKIGAATLSGSFWYGKADRDTRRTLNTDLKADRIDFDALKALADLLLGGNWADTTGFADSFEVRLAAGSLGYQDFAFKDVAVDARYADDVLTVVRLAAGFDGGTLTVTGGRLENLRSAPRGRIDGKLDATSLDVPTRFVQRILPTSAITSWLQIAGPALGPASLAGTVTAPADSGGDGLQLKLKGTAGGTAADVTVVTRKPGDWRNAPVEIVASFDAQTSAGLVRQAGLAAAPATKDVPAHLEVRATGNPITGLDATASAMLGGVTAAAKGKLAISDAFALSFSGTVDATSDNLDRAIALAGMGIPGSAIGTSAKLTGDVALASSGASLKWSNATIAGERVSGALSLAPAADRGWRVDGALGVEDVDLGWLMALGLGFAPVPSGDQSAPWSKTPFISPVYGPLSGRIAVTAARLSLSDRLDLRNARFDMTLTPQQMDVDLTAGEVSGGTATGGFTIHNIAGNANVSGRFNLSHAALESLVWRVDGRPVATGLLDLSANFEGNARTPAGLIASATGGGALSVTAGEARYLDPAAARTIVRASDLGQKYSEAALRDAFGQVIAADSLKFDRADAAFTIAAGAVRLKGLNLRTNGLEVTADAVADLNTLSLDSDWTLTFDPGDLKVQAANPKVGLVFRGALDAPKRAIDVLPLAAYLNTRLQARMLDIIALEDATRLERDRLTRVTRRISEEETRRANEARAEAQRKAGIAAALAAVSRLHDNRENNTNRLMVAGLKAYADRLAAEAVTAQRAADAARRAIDTQRPMAEAAQAALNRALDAERNALTQTNISADALAASKAAFDKANLDLQVAIAASAPTTALEAAKLAAERAFGEKALADAVARIAYVNVQLTRSAAQATLEAATAEATRLVEASRNASRDSAAKSAAAASARQAADRAAAGASPFATGEAPGLPALRAG